MTGQIFVFVFKAGIVLLALLLIYKWLLSGDKQPVFNRVLLLSFYLIAPVAVTVMDMHPWAGNAMSRGKESVRLKQRQSEDCRI